jgi:ketosteroid isomerase-like protein
MFAEDMVFTLPGFSGRLDGREAIVASYREFMERVTLTSYREEPLAVHVWGDTAVASYRWDMAWLAGGVPNHETGHDVFAFRHTNGAWLAIWRTMTFDQKSA